MRGIRAHGILLAVMLIFAYQAWTPNDPRPTNTNPDGTAAIWELSPDQLRTVTFEWAGRTTVLEQRDDADASYLWGTSFVQPPDDSSGEAAEAEQFPLGQQGEDIWGRIANLRGLRDLGVIGDAAKEEYALLETERRLTVSAPGVEHTLEIGGVVFGTNQRYALDPSSGRAYVLGDQLIRALEGGSSALMLRTLHRFDWDDVATVTVRGTSSERTMARRPGAEAAASAWVSSDAPDEPDQAFENFMNHVRALAFSSFESTASLDTMELLVRIDYRGEAQALMGFMTVHRVATAEPDIWDYFFHTEATRIPARAHRSLAERVDRDLADVF